MYISNTIHWIRKSKFKRDLKIFLAHLPQTEYLVAVQKSIAVKAQTCRHWGTLEMCAALKVYHLHHHFA